MILTAHRLTELVESELAELDDARVTAHVRNLLVPPSPVMRAWDYGTGDEAYPCWSVLASDEGCYDRCAATVSYPRSHNAPRTALFHGPKHHDSRDGKTV